MGDTDSRAEYLSFLAIQGSLVKITEHCTGRGKEEGEGDGENPPSCIQKLYLPCDN